MEDKQKLAIGNYKAMGWTPLFDNTYLKNGNKLIRVLLGGGVREEKDFDLLRLAGCLDHESEIIRVLSAKIHQLSQTLESLSQNFYHRND